MTRAVLADTGPLYAALDSNDQHHRRAQEDLQRLTHERREVIIAYPILVESYRLVLYRLGKQTASAWLNETTIATAKSTLNSPIAETIKLTCAQAASQLLFRGVWLRRSMRATR